MTRHLVQTKPLNVFVLVLTVVEHQIEFKLLHWFHYLSRVERANLANKKSRLAAELPRIHATTPLPFGAIRTTPLWHGKIASNNVTEASRYIWKERKNRNFLAYPTEVVRIRCWSGCCCCWSLSSCCRCSRCCWCSLRDSWRWNNCCYWSSWSSCWQITRHSRCCWCSLSDCWSWNNCCCCWKSLSSCRCCWGK